MGDMPPRAPGEGGRRQRLGRRGEELAARHLAAKGYQIVERNWRCAQGELDLVACDGECLAFVEVRTRRGRALGTPEESVSATKQARLVALAEAYLQAHDWPGSCRIDVIAIEMDAGGRLCRVEHYENAVQG
jgi:putative endonuclease